jgi:hypothetical protein
MMTQVGYEIDSEGNVGNETRRIEDLQLRFILLMTIINSNLATDLETKQRLSKYAVNTCHKESGIPMSELKSLIMRMTKEVKEITDSIEKKMQEWEAAR